MSTTGEHVIHLPAPTRIELDEEDEKELKRLEKEFTDLVEEIGEKMRRMTVAVYAIGVPLQLLTSCGFGIGYHVVNEIELGVQRAGIAITGTALVLSCAFFGVLAHDNLLNHCNALFYNEFHLAQLHRQILVFGAKPTVQGKLGEEDKLLNPTFYTQSPATSDSSATQGESSNNPSNPSDSSATQGESSNNPSNPSDSTPLLPTAQPQPLLTSLLALLKCRRPSRRTVGVISSRITHMATNTSPRNLSWRYRSVFYLVTVGCICPFLLAFIPKVGTWITT